MGNWVSPGVGDVGSYQVSGDLYVVAHADAARTIKLKYVSRAINVTCTDGTVLELYDKSDNKRTITLTAGTHRFEVKCVKFGFTNAGDGAGAIVEMTPIKANQFIAQDFTDLGT